MDFYTSVSLFSKQMGIALKSILEFWYILQSGDGIDNSKLIQTLGLAKSSLNLIKKEYGMYLEPTSHQTKLTPEGIVFAKTYDWSEYVPLTARYQFLFTEKSDKHREDLHQFLKLRPSSDRALDQFTATEETVYRRARLMDIHADLRGKKVLLLGDDDFLSVAISYLAKPQSVTVLDIDKRILNTLKDISPKLPQRISAIGYDATNQLPKMFADSFDTVFTDPPYTTNGIELFLSRAVSALNTRNRLARVYLCFGNSDAAGERYLPIYDIISKCGLMVREVYDKFNFYQGAESIGCTSTLFVLEYTAQTGTLVKGTYDKKIYTNN